MAIIHGTNLSDVQFGLNVNDTIYGGPKGNPFVGTGYDTQFGLGGNDSMFGGDGNDTQYGDDGHDHIHGGIGTDDLDGGPGNDTLNGGPGADNLVGGPNADTFKFTQGDSPIAAPDTISDWDVALDSIDMPIAGGAANYSEDATNLIDIPAVAAHANAFYAGDTYLFLFNGATNTGYLVADLDSDNVFETGVTLVGAGAAGDLNWTDII